MTIHDSLASTGKAMSNKIDERAKLEQAYTDSLQRSIDARTAVTEAKVAIMDFDVKHPEVMRAVHDAAGEAKKAARGSTGTTVEAEGHATLPSVEGEGR